MPSSCTQLTSAGIDPESIVKARRAIAGHVCRTPLVLAHNLSANGRSVLLKLESAQPVGSFKLRGAVTALLALTGEELARGVVCASTGNHGRAVAYAAAGMGVRATVCMSSLVPGNKVAAIREVGATIRIVGTSQDEAQVEVERLVATEGMTEIPPFDHPDIIAGQGSIGLEILDDAPDVDTVIVPLSGGGLISGVALAVKAARPSARIVGVSSARGPAMHASLAAGRPIAVKEEPTLADCLGGGIGLANRYTFAMVRDLVDEIVLLSEEQIAQAMRALFMREGWVAEGAGAVGVALLIDPSIAELGQRVAVVVSGRNIDMGQFLRVIEGDPTGEVRHG